MEVIIFQTFITSKKKINQLAIQGQILLFVETYLTKFWLLPTELQTSQISFGNGSERFREAGGGATSFSID